MSTGDLPILNNPAVRERTSTATRHVLEQRADSTQITQRFFSPEELDMLEQLVDTILPQASVGTHVAIANSIGRRLSAETSGGWRHADLPPDGEAYRLGLTIFHRMLEHTPMKTFGKMPPPAREGYLRCVANGDVDTPAQFPLSKWLQMLRSDVVRFWITHPEGMRAIGFYGFADGATGNEGWQAIGPNSAAPFEYEGTGDIQGAAPSVEAR